MERRLSLGKQLIAEFWFKSSRSLNDPDKLRECLLAAAKAGGFTIVGSNFHQFSPHGVTGVVLLAESHMSIHTWPEYNYAAVDVFTCGGAPDAALEELKRRLDVDRVEIRELDRGIMGPAQSRQAHPVGCRAVEVS